MLGRPASSTSDAQALRELAGAVASIDGPESNVADLAQAAAFVANPPADGPRLVVLLGGTGAGKSTLVNRLIGVTDRGEGAIVGTSFRRTFTSGPVAVTQADVPKGWLGLPHRIVEATDLPARGESDVLLVVRHEGTPGGVVLIDTPDVDGDIVEHHARADRAFRWATGVVLVATPEKYQLPEIARYAELAARWGLGRLFVLNKADDVKAADDWAQQLDGPTVYVVPRDDASLVVPTERSLDDLKEAIAALPPPDKAGHLVRSRDVAGRATDAVLALARDQRRRCDAASARLKTLIRPEAGVDVHPMTRHLQRRLRQQSVLYLMGPGRMIDRVKGVPAMVARLPRSTWDLITKGTTATTTDDEPMPDAAPDVVREAEDAFAVFVARCDDVLRGEGLSGEATWKLPKQHARQAVQAQIDTLRSWLEARWDKKPRDTRAIEWLSKHVPGGQHVAKLSETAPYLLIAASAASNAVMGPVDQVVIGGYLLTTWLGEKLSNEVASKSRETNNAIGRAFAGVCDEQVKAAVAWAGSRAADAKAIARLEAAIDAVYQRAEAAS